MCPSKSIVPNQVAHNGTICADGSNLPLAQFEYDVYVGCVFTR